LKEIIEDEDADEETDEVSSEDFDFDKYKEDNHLVNLLQYASLAEKKGLMLKNMAVVV
jgi:hypothetical protein